MYKAEPIMVKAPSNVITVGTSSQIKYPIIPTKINLRYVNGAKIAASPYL
jgi:hypothetical protein